MRKAAAISIAVHGAAVLALLAAGLNASPLPPVTAPAMLTVSLARLTAKPAPPPPAAIAPAAEPRREAPPKRPAPRPKVQKAAAAMTSAPLPKAESVPVSTNAPVPPTEDLPAPPPASAPASVDGPVAPDSSWLAAVHARLVAAKRYPPAALRRRSEGAAVIEIEVDRAGRIHSSRLLRGTGFASLDREALEMVKRASSVPAMPVTMPQARMTLVIPVHFTLR